MSEERNGSGLTLAEKVIAAAISVALGGLHLLPSPGVPEMGAKMDAVQKEVAMMAQKVDDLTGATRTLFAKTDEVSKKADALDTAVQVIRKGGEVDGRRDEELKDHEGRLRDIERQIDAKLKARPTAPLTRNP